MSRRKYSISIVRFSLLTVALIFCIATNNCGFLNILNPNCPQVLSQKTAASNISKLVKNNGRLDVAAFFQGNLYIETGAGLFEYSSLGINRGYTCSFDSGPDDFSKTVYDAAHGLLWTYNIRTATLLRFDGKVWSSVSLPPPDERGYYSRGDIQSFQMYSTDSHFWLQISMGVWRWDNEDSSWVSESLPTLECPSGFDDLKLKPSACFASLIPLSGNTLAIFHSRDLQGLVVDGKLSSDLSTIPPDRIFVKKQGGWVEKVIKNSNGLYTKEVALSGEHGFVRTFDGSLFRISESAAERLPTIGQVDAITVTAEGNLLAGFHSKGIFEYKDGNWAKRFDYPFSSIEGDRVTLIENNGRIAMAWNAPLVNMKRAGPPRLWVAGNGELKEISF